MKQRKIDVFSETSLVVLISIVTLLLQLISFVTTWSGSKIYLEGVFPFASLLFAIAIQATAYFFSNSLRNKVSVLKIIALLAVIGCSTYYSYIGIYNSVNSPVTFLQEKYARMESELTDIYDAALEENLGEVREAIQNAASKITAEYTVLFEENKNIAECRNELSGETGSHAEGMRAPRQTDYEKYEDYVAAYNAYVAGISAGSNTEKEAGRSGILSSFGFASMEELNEEEALNASSLNALCAALGVSIRQDNTAVVQTISDISVSLSVSLDEAMMGKDFDSTDKTKLNTLFQAAKLCGYEGISASDVTNIVQRAAEATKEPLLSEYTTLVASLEDGRVTSANTMELKGIMDSEILMALMKINSLLSEEEQISYSDEKYAITDLYLIPMQSLKDSATKTTAVFCLGVAALIDMLSILLAISLRNRKPLWKRHTLLFSNQEDYMPQIYATLPQTKNSVRSIADFLSHFTPGSGMQSDGYMMYAKVKELDEYRQLVALLCQLNMAKLIPVGLLENEEELLLLKARFVFLANSIIYEETGRETEVSA